MTDGKITIRAGRFVREMPDGTILPLHAPTTGGLANATFATRGVNHKNKKRTDKNPPS